MQTSRMVTRLARRRVSFSQAMNPTCKPMQRNGAEETAVIVARSTMTTRLQRRRALVVVYQDSASTLAQNVPRWIG